MSACTTLPAPSPIAACGCGSSYAADEWMKLPRRIWVLGDETLEIAECTCCRSTIAAPVEVLR